MKNTIKAIGLRMLLLTGVSLIIASFLMETAEAKGPEWKAPQLKITNVRDATFTVSWITRKPETCRINYGTDPSDLNDVCYDDRGDGTEDDTHYVTIKNLSPDTLYYFDVISDDRVYDQKGRHFICTTGPTLAIPSSKTVYGQVFEKDGADADGAIVYVTIKDKDRAGSPGSSAEISCLASSGYWYVNLGSARTNDLNGYFEYSSSGDRLDLSAQGAGDGVDKKKIDTGTPLPIPAMRLKGERNKDER